MIKVYHGKNFMNMSAGHAQWPEDYKLVATVDAPTREMAFEMTNHVEKDWAKNDGVTAEPGLHRSSSVGDIMVLSNGEIHKVAPIGWTLINSATAGDS